MKESFVNSDITASSSVRVIEDAWKKTLLNQEASIRDAISCLSASSMRIVLVVSDGKKLQGTISDGDIRRGLLRGMVLDSSISDIVHRNALVVPPSFGPDMIIQLMRTNKLQQIPIVDEHQQVVGLHVWDEIAVPRARQNPLVIMAGGRGTRLMPHTTNCPKPLVPVAGKPMLEHIIERAKAEGFHHFIIAINHLGHMIEDFLEDGGRLGIRVEYIKESSSLGTVGALSLLSPRPEMPVVVTNGDVITDIHYGELLDFHSRHNATATMAVRAHEWQHPFGVVQTAGINIIGFEEKPVMRSYINAGVYVVNPDAFDFLNFNQPCDMPTLFERAQLDGRRVIAYPMHEPWLDVGKPDDLIQANKDIKSQRNVL